MFTDGQYCSDTIMMHFICTLAFLLPALSVVSSFSPTGPIRSTTTGATRSSLVTLSFSATTSADTATNINNTNTRCDVEILLTKKYPSFWRLLSPAALQVIRSPDAECTIFAPSERAFENLGKKKLLQLKDPRNLEFAEKMGAYHIIPTQAINAERLRREDWTVPKVDGKPQLAIGGVRTMGGEVRVGRSKSGGFLGWGSKEDGGIVIGADSKIVISFNVGKAIVHEVDGFVSPELLWRYCDQLRILGV
jgi:uncharacterized surface protein with fasciclin (FAS1) repeats